MNAFVSAEAWRWYCPECDEGSEITFDSAYLAERDAEEHDKENHR